MQIRSKMSRLLYKSGFIVFTLVITEILLRIILAIAPLGPKQTDYLNNMFLWHSYGVMNRPSVASAYVRFKNNPKINDHNSLGFHSPEIPRKKPEGYYRIAFLGGSTTYDRGPMNQTYPHFVTDFLHNQGLPVDYVNAGIGGYTTTESLLTYHLRLRSLNPDLVILYNGRNDLYLSANRFYSADDLTNLKHPNSYNYPPELHQLLSRLVKLYALSMEIIGYRAYRDNNWRYKWKHDHVTRKRIGIPQTADEFMDNIKTERVYEPYKRNVEALSVLTGYDGVKLVLIGFDYNYQNAKSGHIPKDRPLTQEEKERLNSMIKGLNRILRETAEKFPHVYFFDLYSKIERDHFNDDCHLNEAGKRHKGRLVGEFLWDRKETFGW